MFLVCVVGVSDEQSKQKYLSQEAFYKFMLAFVKWGNTLTLRFSYS